MKIKNSVEPEKCEAYDPFNGCHIFFYISNSKMSKYPNNG